MGFVFSLTLIGLLAASGGISNRASGTVVDADGKPVDNALVVVAKSRGSESPTTDVARDGRLGETTTLGTAKTDESGAFVVVVEPESLNDWPRARLSIWAYADGRAIAVRRLDPDAPGSMPPLRLVLGRPEVVAMRLEEADGSPAHGARLTPEWVRGFLVPAELAARLCVEADEQGAVAINGVHRPDLQTIHVLSEAAGIQWTALPRGPTTEPVVVSLATVGRIEGRVRFDEGQFTAQAILQLATAHDAADGRLGGGVAEAICDEQGRFEAPRLAAGTLSVSVKSSSEPLCVIQSEQSPSVQPDVVNRLETRLVRPLKIAGEVRHAEEAIPGATVLLSSPLGQYQAVCDEQGRFIGRALPGELTARVVRMPAPYFWPNALPVQYVVAEEEIIVELDPLLVGRGMALKGRVVDAAGRPVARAEVLGYWHSPDGLPKPVGAAGQGFRARQAPVARRGSLGTLGGGFGRPAHTWTDQDGRFTIGCVASDAGICLWAIAGDSATKQPTTLKVGDAECVLVVEPDCGVSLDGRVVDPQGRPVPGAAILASMDAVTPARYPQLLPLDCFSLDAIDAFRTDTEGDFRTPGILPRDMSYTLTVTAPGFMSAETESLQPATWQTTTFADVMLWPELALRTVRGRVIDRQGRPVPGTKVWQAGNGPRPTETAADEDGAFALPGVYDRPDIVFARADGFRLLGVRTFSAEGVEIVLDRANEPTRTDWPPPAAESWSLEKRRAWSRKLVEPFLSYLEEPGGSWTLLIAEIVATVDPESALEIAARPTTPLRTQCWLRQYVAPEIVRDDVDSGLKVLAQIGDVRMRSQAYLEVFDGLDDDDAVKHGERLLEAAVAHERSVSQGRDVFVLSQIALRWFDLADLLTRAAPGKKVDSSSARERGAALASQAQRSFQETSDPNRPSPAPPYLASAVAWIDGPAATLMLEGLRAHQNDWYSADVARALAGRDPQLAETALKRLQYPNLRALYTQGVLQRMARADAARAAEIARSQPVANQQAYCLALVAGVLAARDGPQARQLFDDAFSRLERGPRESHGLGNYNAAVTALAMLPIAEHVAPDRVEEYFWRGLAFRPPLPADGQLSYSLKMDLAALAQFAARYDRAVARDLAEPLLWQFRKGMAQLIHGNTGAQALLATFASVDPQWALDVVQSLPDVEDKPFESPRQIAGLFLARKLAAMHPRSREASGFRSLDARPSQR